ncbi:integral membrane protein [Colletotrichum scovillei]|uniref:Integral membrane protein n=1 Tax=Colletotrichum scovillei TaxID=1209932 RepID=A0A9P7QPX2_9PEZI|nr:integral membrane protein [Colletotrichum scovillei]
MGTHLTGYVLDVLVCGLPLPWAWQHAAQKRSIYGVVFLFVLGNIVVAISISRLVSIINTAAGTYPTLDPSWYGYVPAVLATVENTNLVNKQRADTFDNSPSNVKWLTRIVKCGEY